MSKQKQKYVYEHELRAENKGLKWSMELLGCTMGEFCKHIRKQFKMGMCWRNYALPSCQGGWELDHIIPASFCEKSEYKQLSKRKQLEMRKKMVHYKNIQPLFRQENAKKRDQVPI